MMTEQEIEETKERIASELKAGLMQRFIGEKVNASTLGNIKAYINSFMRRYGDEEYSDIPKPQVSVNGNEITISWE
jgi:hypothetical protein